MPAPTDIDIAGLVPHAGDMVLIDAVEAFDPAGITCRARIDDPAAHPLALAGALPATALAEYGAQAMAVHGGLLAASDTPPRRGLLAALGRLDLAVAAIDRPLALTIRAELAMNEAGGQIYTFEIAGDDQHLASGQATVMFPDEESD